MDHLNYCVPYQDKRDYWEDPLTRAFLLIIKYVPAVQQLFIDLIREKQGAFETLHQLPSYASAGTELRVDCQTSTFQNDDGILISVFITDESVEFIDPVTVADRNRAVYDGILYLGDNITVIIENKPSAGALRRDQLNPSKESLEGKDIKPVGHPICLTWAEILDRINILERKDIFSFAEKQIIKDFSQFIDNSPRFSNLKPYKTFAVCGNNDNLLNKRCRNILEQLGEVKHHPGWGDYLEFRGNICRKVTLRALSVKASEGILLQFMPGNTVPLAKQMLEQVDIDKLKKREADNWEIYPNFHFADSFRQFFWSKTSMDVWKYLDYWKEHPEYIHQYGREEFERLRKEFLQVNMLSQDEYYKLDDSFINSNRTVLRIIPGLTLDYIWPLEEAIEMDRAGQFHEEVETKIRQIFECWNQEYESIVLATKADEVNDNSQ